MDVLGDDWLRPLIEAALCKCLSRALPEGREYIRYQKLQPQPQPQPTTGDAEADVRVQVFTLRDTRCLQVTKWCTPDPPYHAVISDSYTRVKASFSKEAIHDFVIEMQKPLSRGTKGAVITVHDFDLIIRAGDDAEEDEDEDDDDDDDDDVGDAITIVIKEFELEGCEGSREYGRPENVVSISPIRELLNELLARRRRKHDVGPVDEAGATVTITPEDVAIPREQEKMFLHTQWADADGSIDIESEPPVPRKLWEKWDELVLEHVRQKMDDMSVEEEVDEGLTSSMPFGSQEKLKMSIYGDGDESESESRDDRELNHVRIMLPPDTP